MMGGTVGSSIGVINVSYAPILSKGTYRGLTLCRALLGAREILWNIVEVQSGHRADDDLMGGLRREGRGNTRASCPEGHLH